ncbi:MAG: YqaJ viral recombinase family protein [Lentisphaeria bacterium]|nr:YqaJ viral recombinase family protein [Lentisphaeria bacterium]
MITKHYFKTRDDWLKFRADYIGGSDAAAVVGLNPNVSAFSLWSEKTGQTPAFEGNLATRTGTFLEPFVAELFEEQTGKKIRRENASLINSDYPWAVADVDRLVIGEDAGLEIKTTSALSTKKFKNGEFPPKFYVQCVHYLAVTGKKKWYLAVLIGNFDFRIYEINRDEDEIKALMEAECAFWNDYVLPKSPPPPDGETPTDESLKVLYPESNGESMELFGRDALLDRYFDLADQIKELQRQQDEIKQTIQLDMGETETGTTDAYKVIWKSQTRSTFDAKRFAADHPELKLDPYYKTTKTRAFKVNRINKKEEKE